MVTYFDHAATSWPKPPSVEQAVMAAFGESGGNPGRSGHRMSIAAARVVEDARDAVAEVLGAADPGSLVFTKNATEALNIAILGTVEPGDHVVTTSIEHNSVMRPLRFLQSRGVDLTVVPCAEDGTIDPTAVGEAFRPATTLLVTTHGSNVVGSVLPVAALAAIARGRGVAYVVDAAQTAGSMPLAVEDLGVDMLAFAGHKGLLGPTGTGGLFVRPGVLPLPLMRGGTGSRSDSEEQPGFLPDLYESGTLNVLGLGGLAAGARHLLDVGLERIASHERDLVARFRHGAAAIAGLILYGPRTLDDHCGVVSFNIDGLASSDVSTLLDREFGILSRPGLHCAPGAHRTIGTFPTGTVRFGFGFTNTATEIDGALLALTEIAAWARKRDVP